MIYQIQTKFRDEGRARGGLIRVREFKMKDAYSFHINQEDLEKYYYRAYAAYERIFKRIGMKNFIAVTSDSGMMGGKISHEFMLLTDVGEDTLVLCPECGYKSNMEVATSVVENYADDVELPLEEVYTADAKEIAQVTQYLGDIPAYKTVKAVCYNIKGDSETTVVCFVRGDLEVNEAKLKKVLLKEVVPAGLEGSALVAGNIGCLGIEKLPNVVVVYDNSLKGANNMVTGANKEEYHIKNLSFNRDINVKEFFDIAKVVDGARCAHCGAPLKLQNGIEIGNIFQLGTKYTESMGMTVLNKDGKSVTPIMGCYGIGVGRAIASIAEESADDKGLNWPMAIAPWHVYLCALRTDDPVVREKADKLYEDLQSAGIEVLYDDRNVSPGFKFNDCDLMGIPIRVVISPRSIQNGIVEVQLRDGSYKDNLSLDTCVSDLKKIILERI